MYWRGGRESERAFGERYEICATNRLTDTVLIQGRVKLGIHKVSGEKVAIKIISKSHLASNASVERAVKREIAVMKLIHHPNIMSLLDVIDLSDSPNLCVFVDTLEGLR